MEAQVLLNYKELAFFIKNTKKQPLFSKWIVENTKSWFEENPRTFSKNPPLKKILEFQDRKKDYEAYTEKKSSNQKLNQWLKTYKMSFINYEWNDKLRVASCELLF